MVALLWAHRFVTICGCAVIALATATACSRPKTETLNEAGKDGATPGLTGVWKSDGYGFVFVGKGDMIQTYEVTQTTCVPTAKKWIDPVGRTKWTPGQPSLVRPSTRPGFRGPVVELIGPLTISAGETMTQALMGRSPKVLRIGENTQGVFSDVLRRTLPNGWYFGLPNEVFRSPEGKTFDGTGIPPDIEVPVFAVDDLAAGRDPGLERAQIELYRNR